MGLHKRAVPGRTSGARRELGPRTRWVVVSPAEDVSVALAEPRAIRTVLGENLEVQFAAEIEQAFEAHAVKVFIANSGTQDWSLAAGVIHGWGLPKHGVASNPLNPQLAGVEGLTACQEPTVRVLPVGTIWTTVHGVECGYGKTGAIVVGMPHPLDA